MQADTVAPDGFVHVSLAELMALQARARGLSFVARQPLSSILSGNHASRLRGRGLSFEELRHYLPGDDLRHLDWRASLRYGKAFVRTFSEERDRPTLVLVDQRMSMYFGSQRYFKSVSAAQLAAVCAWMALHASDRVGGMVFGDHHVDFVRPLRSRARVEALCSAVVKANHRLTAYASDDEHQGQLDKVLRSCIACAGHDHLICIISDFAGIGPGTLPLLRQLSRHNDVIAIQVYDPIAMQLPEKGRLNVTQGAQQVELEIGQRRVNRPLGEFLAGRLRDVAQLLQRSQVPLLTISCGDDSLEQLRRELGRLAQAAR
ncbi:DUF58 domain-containing protein [Pseudomonas sp. TWI929]|uniref:DUF58 domain-containing protein n=1 Tax=Pseudomonas sp. TWI929 TaxID=3136795 RepID=UPI00320855F3